MKRRTFINTVICGSLLPPAFGSTSMDFEKRKAHELFSRFFFVANGFKMNDRQEKYWEQYYNDFANIYSGSRQVGQTTFMLTLALYEKKCLGANNVIICYNEDWVRMMEDRIDLLESRLGKSVKDGRLDVCTTDGYELRIRVYDKSFIMNDAGVNTKAHMSKSEVSQMRYINCFAKKYMFFGTHETHESDKYYAYDPSKFNITTLKVNVPLPKIY